MLGPVEKLPKCPQFYAGGPFEFIAGQAEVTIGKFPDFTIGKLLFSGYNTRLIFCLLFRVSDQ